jgi:peptidoglycan L-alanyl-D-glutamate endopeptidase CwlK
MKDQKSIERIYLLHPHFRDQATAFIDTIEPMMGRTFRIVQGMRTFAEQTAIYNQGRTTPGKIVTYSPAGTSYHNFGLAIDICPFVLNSTTQLDWSFDFKKIRDAAISNGLQCGMDFPHPDYDHFENKYGYNWRDLLHKYNAKDFILGTEFVNI